MENLKDIQDHIKGLVNDRWIGVGFRLTALDGGPVPKSLVDDVMSMPIKQLEGKLNYLEVIFSFDGYYHHAHRFTATELAHKYEPEMLFRAVTQNSLLGLANAAFHAKH